MIGSNIHANTVEAIALPQIVQLRPNLLALVFRLMKLLPARFIIRRAAEQGALPPGGSIAESTSGTFGMALALIARLQGYRLTLVTDPAIAPLRTRLEDLGTTLHVVREPAPEGGFQRARLDLLQRVLADHPGTFWPQQYSNPHNPESYAPCAEQLAHAAGRIDCLVGSVGSGGSVCGTSSYLRLLFPELTVIGVDTFGSVIFGHSDMGARRTLRGLGNSVIPPLVDHAAFDWVHWVDGAEAFQATRQLHRKHALYMGPTSGAAYLVADWWAREHPDKLTAVILPDEGHRYEDTVYRDSWLKANGIMDRRQVSSPREVDRPRDGDVSWCFCPWGRRSYEAVIGRKPSHQLLSDVRLAS
jgi:cysteine synthase